MDFGQFRKARERRDTRKEIIKERRPRLSTQEERFLYSLHLKTIELRTLTATLREHLPREVLDEITVDYHMRLRKAKKNFESHNFKDEWFEEGENTDNDVS